MEQKNLAERYKGRFGANTKGITSLAASIKRTKTALVDIQNHFTGNLSLEELEALHTCMNTLGRLASQADSAKTEVKRHAAEKQRLQERLQREATEAVNRAFQVDQVDEAVAFLAWNHPLKEWCSTDWAGSIRGQMTADEWWHKHRKPDVMAAVQSEVNDLIRELIRSVATEAEMKGRMVTEILAEASADYWAKRPAIMGKWQPFIQEIKAAGVAQALEKAGGKQA